MGTDPEVTAVLLAKGLIDIFDQVQSEGAPVRQDAALPASARRALALVSRHSLASGLPDDLGACVHTVMDMASRPMGSWGLPGFDTPFQYADVVLVDADLGAPTDDCREMARSGGSELSAVEELHHESLRAAVAGYPTKRRDAAYTDIREFVVRNPAVEYDTLLRFLTERGHAAAASAVMSFYRPVPQSAVFPGGAARRCGHCGSLLWPDRDTAAFPDGRCRVRQCRLANPIPARGEDIEDASKWRVATPAVLAFWVGPGLAEIRIHDALRAKGRASTLYPQQDAADVGVDDLAVGIDVKTYASPVLLGAKLTRSVGRLGIFRRRILAVPDDKLRLNRRYLEQLRAAYAGSLPLEFMTVSDVLGEL